MIVFASNKPAAWVSCRFAATLTVALAAIGVSLPCVAQSIDLTATPNVIKPVNGKLPSTITISLQPSVAINCPPADKDWSKDSLSISGNVGLSAAANPSASGDCLVAFPLTVDPNSTPGAYKLLLMRPGGGTIRGAVDITVADPNAGPIPPGLKPGVDVLWEVMGQKKCSDNFGARVAQFNYCIQLKIGNNSGYPLQIAGVGFSSDPNPKPDATDTTIANSSYASTRAVLLMENVTNGRNIAYNIINAIGVLMPAFAPYFGTGKHPNGTVNNARTNWSTAASIVSGPLLQAFNIVAPNPVIAQLNNLDDQSFRDNRIIANNQQIPTVVFVEKQQLTSQLIMWGQKCKCDVSETTTANPSGETSLNLGNATMSRTITNSTNSRGMFSRRGGFNPYYVKLALGNVVIVGRHIQYLDRVQVVNSATSASGAAPVIGKISLPGGKTTGAIVGDEITLTGSNFGPTQGSSTVTIGAVQVLDKSAYTGWTDSEIKVRVPVGVPMGKSINVKVSAAGGDSAPNTVAILPNIKDIQPPSAPLGKPVTLTGNFGEIAGTVKFGSAPEQPIPLSDWGKTQIKATVPSSVTPGTVNVKVLVNGVESDTTQLTVTAK